MKIGVPGNLRLAIAQYAKKLDQFDSEERFLNRVTSMPPGDVTTQQFETAMELVNLIRQERHEFVKDFARIWLTKKGR